MKKMSNTGKQLLFSVISTFLCVMLLVGMTYAWFTTTVISASNVIKTAAFNVDVLFNSEYTDSWIEFADNSMYGIDSEHATVFLPGTSVIRYIKFVNNSEINVKFELVFPKMDADSSTLASNLDVYTLQDVTGAVEFSALNATGKKLATYNGIATATTPASILSEVVSGGESKVVAFGLKLPTDFSDSAAVYSDTFKLKVVVTQYDIAHDDVSGTFNATEGATLSTPQATVVVPAGAKTEDNVVLDEGDTLNLTVIPDEDANFTVETGSGSSTFEITLTNQDNKKVVSADGIMVYLDVGFVELQGFYHNNVALTAVGSAAAVTEVGQYYYDVTTGIITFKTDSFSPYTAVFKFAGGLGTESAPYKLKTADQWNGVYKLFAAKKETPVYFELANDIDFTGKTVDNYASETAYSYDIFNLHLDGKNHSLVGINRYTGYKQLFPYIYDSTISNLTINYNMDSASTLATAYNASNVVFENVTVTGTLKTTADWACAFVAYPYGSGTIVYRNCTNRATLITNLTSSSYVAPFGSHTMSIGGITLENCKNYGDIVGGNASAFIGMTGGNTTRYTVGGLENYGKVRYSISGNLFTYGNHALNAVVVEGEGSSVAKVGTLNAAIENGKLVIKDADANSTYKVTMSVPVQMYNYNNSGAWTGSFPRSLSKTYSGSSAVDGTIVTDFTQSDVRENPGRRTGYGQDGAAVTYNGIFVPDTFDLDDDEVTVLIEDENSVISLVQFAGETFYYVYDEDYPEWYGLVTTANGAESGEYKGTITVSLAVEQVGGDYASASVSYTFNISDAANVVWGTAQPVVEEEETP